MMQVSDLKTALEARGDQASAGSSPWSTVVDGESLGKRSAMGAKRWSSRSPRPTRKQGHASPVKLAGDGRVKKDDKLQCTPNGTRIPDGPPPMDDVSRMPSCPPPPVPPFPIPHTADAASDLTEKMDLKAYEVCQDGPLRGRMGDPGWKPTSEKSLTPQEAKSAWLEREVNSLKKVLEKVATDGNSFDISKTWPLKEGCHQCLSKPRHWSSGVCCMVNMFMEIGLLCKVLQHCMAWRLVNLNLKLGLCMVLGRVVCLVKLLFMVGHCMALFLVMELFMVGHCMARFLVMEHFLIGLCMVVLRSLGFKILFNKGILFKERKGKELWVLHQCQHHGNLLVEVVAESWSCQRCQMVPRRWSLETGFVFVGQSWKTYLMSLEDGGMLRCVKLMPSTWNGRDYLLFSEFNFALVFLKNWWQAASSERSSGVSRFCSKQWAMSNKGSWWWIETSAAQRYFFACMCDINQVDLAKRQSSWANWLRCKRRLQCRIWLLRWEHGGDTLQELEK